MPDGAGGFSISEPTWFEDGGWDEADLPPRAWLAPGYFLRGAVTLLIGPGGVSKSTLVIAYAVALALGCDLHGMRPACAFKSLVYNVEDDATEQRRRFSAVLASMGRTPADIAGRVARIGPQRLGMLLDRDPETGAIRHTAAWTELEQKIREVRPDVLFLDPLAELHGEDENANTALREVVAEFRSLAVKHALALVLVHHTRKGLATPGDPDSGRGASSIASACRVVLTVNAMTKDEAAAFGMRPESCRHHFRVDGGKSNYASLTECEWFERHAYTLANGDLVAVPLRWTPPDDAASPDVREAIHAAVAIGSGAGPWSVKLSSDPRSIKRLLAEHGVVTAPGQRAAVDHLLASGFHVMDFKRSNRSKAQGLRSPDGLPGNVEWIEADAA